MFEKLKLAYTVGKYIVGAFHVSNEGYILLNFFNVTFMFTKCIKYKSHQIIFYMVKKFILSL